MEGTAVAAMTAVFCYERCLLTFPCKFQECFWQRLLSDQSFIVPLLLLEELRPPPVL